MPQRQEPFVYNFSDDFLGGVNSYFPANKLAQNFMTQSQNAWVNENGILTRRPGITKVGTVPALTSARRILRMLVAGGGTQKKLYAVLYDGLDTHLASYDGSNWLTTQSSVTGSVFGDATWVKESDGTEYLYLCGESISQNVYKATITASGVAPTVTAWPTNTNTDPQRGLTRIFLHDQWVFGAGLTLDNREKLYYSSNWPYLEVWDRTQFFIAAGTLQGERIVTAHPYQESNIFLGLEGSCYLLRLGGGSIGLDSSLTTVSRDIGVGSRFGNANVGEDIIFMDQYREMRSLTQTLQERGAAVRSVPISLPIKDKLDALPRSLLMLVQSAFHAGKLWLSFPNASDDLAVGAWDLWVWDIHLQKWFGPMILKDSSGNQLNVHSMAVSAQSPGSNGILTGSSHLYFGTDDVTGGTSRLQVYELDDTVFQDAGAINIDMDVITRASDMESPHVDKHFRTGEVTYKQVTGTTGSFKLSARVDFGPWNPMGTFFYTSGDEIITSEFDMRRLPRGRLLQFRIECSDANTHPEIERLIVTGHLLPRK